MKRLLFILLCACALQTTASAHVLDQYLQVAQVALAPEGVRVELRLIPGVQVADRIFALIDVNGDGQISSSEEQSYAQRIVQDIAFEMDSQPTPLTLTGVQFPSRREMQEGIGAIRLNLATETALGSAGEHQISFRNDHFPELGVYLVNALVPAADAIKITRQQRDQLQHELRVDFGVLPADTSVWPCRISLLVFILSLTALLLSQWKRLRRFLGAQSPHQVRIDVKSGAVE